MDDDSLRESKLLNNPRTSPIRLLPEMNPLPRSLRNGCLGRVFMRSVCGENNPLLHELEKALRLRRSVPVVEYLLTTVGMFAQPGQHGSGRREYRADDLYLMSLLLEVCLVDAKVVAP